MNQTMIFPRISGLGRRQKDTEPSHRRAIRRQRGLRDTDPPDRSGVGPATTIRLSHSQSRDMAHSRSSGNGLSICVNHLPGLRAMQVSGRPARQ